MMMPANYSVIAENEMTYVAAGGVNDADGASVTPSRRGALTGGFMLDEG
jgi:hypothetical protein